jgi:hypothetical protein
MGHLNDSMRSADNDSGGLSPGASQDDWSRRLRSELGRDIDDLFPIGDQTVWWARIQGRREPLADEGGFDASELG